MFLVLALPRTEMICGEQEAASASGQEPVDIVTPVATILKQIVRFTTALVKINWQAGQRIQYNIFLASVKTKGLDEAAKLAPAVSSDLKPDFRSAILRLNICKMTTSLP